MPKVTMVAILAIFWVIVLMGTPNAQAQPQAALAGKNVLVLHTLETSTPLTVETNRGLLGAFRIGGMPGANLFFESMDLRRNPSPEWRKLLVEQVRLKWTHRKADMVITVYPEALEFVLKDCGDLFAHVPIIALHLPQDFIMAETDRRIIGHFPLYDITGTMDNALKLVPGTKRVYVVNGVHKIDKWLEDQARRASKKWEERVEFLYLSRMPVDDIMATISKAPPGSLILYLALTQDVAGRSHAGLGLAQQLSQVSAAPVFGLFESALGYGMTGGNLISWNLIGERAAELVIDILKGAKNLDDVPSVLDVPSVPMFDWRQLRRWNLSEAALPKGSLVINREETIWDYKYHIMGVLVFCLVETALIVFLIVQRRRKKVAEEDLRQKKVELDQFFDVSLDLLCIAHTEGHFLRLNPAWERTLGYTREELMAKPFLDFVHPDDVPRSQEAVSAQASQQRVMRFENRYRCKDGTYRWLDWSSAPAGGLIYAEARDITERKRAEECLRTSEALSTGVLASLPGQMVIVDASGAILRTSASWPAFAAGDGALDPTVLAVGVGDPQEKAGPVVDEIRRGIAGVLTGVQAEFRLDYAYPTRTEERWASVSVLPLQRPEGGAVLYRQDITLHQRSRLEAEQLRRDLVHVGRVTTMGEMAAALAHELNQPLTAILSNAHAGERYLSRAEPPLDEIREILQDVVGDARRAGEVIQRLRSLVRKEEARFLPMNVNQVIRELAVLVQTEAILRNLAIDLDLAPELPPIRGDRVQLQQVLLNLVLNGMEAMGPQGDAKRIVIRTQHTDAAVCVAVRDQGPGIPSAELSRVFETFYTTKASGMGMGLAISRSIVEAHGGRIWAENNPDRGATFAFMLPASPPEVSPA